MRKYKNSAFDLPEEFYVLDMSRFHYVVVAGRRTDFRDKTYIIKRERKKADDIDIIHYDNLFDFSNNLIGKQTYQKEVCCWNAKRYNGKRNSRNN